MMDKLQKRKLYMVILTRSLRVSTFSRKNQLSSLTEEIPQDPDASKMASSKI